jgi:hypothetical protein
MIMMKTNLFCKTVILFGLFLVFSCAQDPIFYTIYNEPVPEKPRIQGSPTNMAVFKRNDVPLMYVASGSLHWYAKTDGGTGPDSKWWDSAEYRIPQPGGKIIGLAATNDHLYALCIIGSGVSTVLRRIGAADGQWQDIIIDGNQYTLIQSIFADKDALFAGTMNNNGNYGIRYLVDDPLNGPTLRLLNKDTENTEMLSGAVRRGEFHYLSTRGKGIYKVATDISSVEQLADLDNSEDEGRRNRLFMGMIQLEDGKIFVVERNGGAFFEVQESGFRLLRYSDGRTVATGRYSTGALALWQEVIRDDNGQNPQPGVKKMLVAGIQGGLYSTTISSSYTHGYVEFELNPDGSLNPDPVRRDNSPSITVDGNTDRYTATIGKHPINYLYQTPREVDANMIFFASTQTAGLWSYRNRTGGLQWNAEN